MTLRLGKWQDVLADVTECDAVITDPPYSERTHKGFRSAQDYGERSIKGIGYDALTQKEVAVFVDRWRAAPWLLSFCDHPAFEWWQRAYDEAGRVSFAPVVWLSKNAPPRFSGDGPTNNAEYLAVSRLRKKSAFLGSRPGYYTVLAPQNEYGPGHQLIIGQKSLRGVRELVADYTPTDGLVVDCYAGSGTTLLAAAMEGRRAIGAEMDPKTYSLAVKRLSKGYTERLFREGIMGKQEPLL